MVAVVTECSYMADGGRHRPEITVAMVPRIGHGACSAGVWVEAYPSKADGCVPLSNNIDMSGLIFPPLDAADAFLIRANSYT